MFVVLVGASACRVLLEVLYSRNVAGSRVFLLQTWRNQGLWRTRTGSVEVQLEPETVSLLPVLVLFLT